jgi:hypothetical protein
MLSFRYPLLRRGVSSPPRPTVILTLIGLVASIAFSAVLGPLAGPASATPPAGTGGVFRPTQARLVDTRINVGGGGYTGKMLANTDRQYQVTGNAGVPSTGVSAVVLSATAVAPAAMGWMAMTTYPVTPGATVMLTWGAGETVSNSAVVAMGSNHQGCSSADQDGVGVRDQR